MVKKDQVVLELAGHPVTISNPGKLYFPDAQIARLQRVE